VSVGLTIRKKRLQAEVRQHVESGATLYTDALKSYAGFAEKYTHGVIEHAEAYARGKVHTNGLENVWSPRQAGDQGHLGAVEPIHLFRYNWRSAVDYDAWTRHPRHREIPLQRSKPG